MARTKPKYRVVFDESDKKWWFKIVHKNGNIITTSEMYTTKAARTRSAKNLAKETGLEVWDE